MLIARAYLTFRKKLCPIIMKLRCQNSRPFSTGAFGKARQKLMVKYFSAILSGRVSGVFFHEIFGHRIEAFRMKNQYDSQTFTDKINEPVLPKFLSIVFDPTISKYENNTLNGFYQYDDEGVKSQKVVVVD